MPRPTRNQEDVDQIREKILDEAMFLIAREGFENLSMRKLAQRLGMTAPNIYNYYSSKDHLYLAIQTNGFEVLSQEFRNMRESAVTPQDALEAMINSYLKFGRENPNFYDIMFSRNTPKYSDYRETELEPVARAEKQAALKTAELAGAVIRELYDNNLDADSAQFMTLQIWTSLHGIVSLYNSRVLQEASDDTDLIIQKMIEDLITRIVPV